MAARTLHHELITTGFAVPATIENEQCCLTNTTENGASNSYFAELALFAQKNGIPA
jgi:hypothetical protein